MDAVRVDRATGMGGLAVAAVGRASLAGGRSSLSADRASLAVGPARERLAGVVRVPGDKSIGHRALILAALAGGKSVVRGLATGADVASTASCLGAMGVEIAAADGGGDIAAGGSGAASVVTVNPPRGGLRPPTGPLFAGNSGTTARLLAGVLAGQPFLSHLDGDASLRRRPMARVTEPLERAGATVIGAGAGAAGGKRALPFSIRGPRPAGPLRALVHDLPVASAQVKSCLLLAGLYAAGRTVVREPGPSRDHTERLLRALGVTVEAGAGWTSLESGGHPDLPPFELDVPGDFSSAAFWIAAGLLVPGSLIRLPAVGVNPGRTGLLRVLGRMGAQGAVVLEGEGVTAGGEPFADIVVKAVDGGGTGLVATTVGPKEIPSLVDEVPVLALIATQAEGTTVVEGAGELRVKETDRLDAVASQLAAMGAAIEVQGDRLVISGPTPLRPAKVDALGDHRMAMTLAVAGLIARARGPASRTEISGFGSVAISYPEFGAHLGRLLTGREAS